MYYKYENSEVTKKVPVVSLQVPQTVGSDDEDDDRIMNEAVPRLKSEERVGDDLDSTGTESSSSRASNDDKWVKHTTRSGHQTGLKSGMYDPSTEKTVQFTAEQNYYGLLVELDNEEVELNNDLADLYVEYSNLGARVGG